MSSHDQVRREFELFATTAKFPTDRDLNDPERYSDPYVQGAWIGWVAAEVCYTIKFTGSYKLD